MNKLSNQALRRIAKVVKAQEQDPAWQILEDIKEGLEPEKGYDVAYVSPTGQWGYVVQPGWDAVHEVGLEDFELVSMEDLHWALQKFLVNNRPGQ